MKITDSDNLLFWHRILYSIANSFISVFLPILIFIYTDNLIYAILHCIIRESAAGLFTLLFKKVIIKNLFLSILLSFIPLIAIQIISSFEVFSVSVIILLALLSAITNPLYFIPLNIFFSHTDKKNNVAKFETGATIGKIGYILFSSYLLSSDWQNSLVFILSLSVIIFSISAIPLFLNRDRLENVQSTDKLTLSETNKLIKTNYHIYHILYGIITTIVNTVIPLYLFYNHLGLEVVSLMVAGGEALKIGANYTAKWLIFKKLNTLNYIIACTIIVLGFISMLFVTLPVVLFIASLAISAGFSILMVASFGQYVEQLKQKNVINNGHVLRDFYILFPRNLIYLLFFIFPSFDFLFIVGIIAGILTFFFRIDEDTGQTK